jgi:formyltetrahydrofolate deformylase
MQWRIHPGAAKMRTLIMVSRFGHCLNDLLFRQASGALPLEIPLVVSNHTDFRAMVEGYGIPFVHLPVDKSNKAVQEARLLELVREQDVELVVLARYMQVLSDETCKALEGRIINIHHSFLPSFKGARPYHQAHERGVKLIGATAHYVTADLDEGPIIEQDVVRAVLNMLRQQGPMTVPQMGRAQAISRQFVQRMVNDAAAAGLVEAAPNPAHKRSSLIRLTAEGSAAIAAVLGHERAALAPVGADLADEDVSACIRVLRRMLAAVDDVSVE